MSIANPLGFRIFPASCYNRRMSKLDANKVKIGLVQMTCDKEPQPNLEKALARIGEAAAQGAQIVCLQELFRSRYFCQSEDIERFKLAEPVPGPTSEAICQAAKQHKVAVIASLFERRAPGLYHNTSVTVDADGEIVGKYRKMHIPDDPAYYEKFYFTPGDLGFEPIQTSVGKLGLLVCWDQWYPEAARLMALAGAEMLIYPTAIGWESTDPEAEKARQHGAWFVSQRAHAVANGLPVIAVNRTGHEPDWTGATGGIQFWGQSFVAGPQGEVLFQAAPDRETVAVVEIDKQRTEDVRRIWPFFRDRRIDFYGGLTKRYLVD